MPFLPFPNRRRIPICPEMTKPYVHICSSRPATQFAAQWSSCGRQVCLETNQRSCHLPIRRQGLKEIKHQKAGDGGISLSKTETPNLSFVPEDVKRSCNIGIVIQELSRPTRRRKHEEAWGRKKERYRKRTETVLLGASLLALLSAGGVTTEAG